MMFAAADSCYASAIQIGWAKGGNFGRNCDDGAGAPFVTIDTSLIQTIKALEYHEMSGYSEGKLVERVKRALPKRRQCLSYPRRNCDSFQIQCKRCFVTQAALDQDHLSCDVQ